MRGLRFAILWIICVIFVSTTFGQEGLWSDPVPVTELNTINNEIYTYLSSDGSILLWNAEGTICMSRWNGENWQPRIILPEPINSEYLERAAAITPDHSHFYWVAWRPGGFGGWDIWRCTWDENTNAFGEAECLGENVNSTSYEFGIGFTPDGGRMYFSSSVFIKNGQQGEGDLDIWYCDWDSTLGDWGLPYNVGRPVNTPGPDFAPYITHNGMTNSYTLFFSGYGSRGIPCWQGNCEIFYAIWDGENWSEIVNICPPVNNDRYNGSGCLTQDGQTIYFISGYDSEPDMHGEIMVSHKLLSVDDVDEIIPHSINIKVYPNPFNLTCKITIEGDGFHGNASLKVYDIQGKEVKDLGKYQLSSLITLTWDGTNNGGGKVSSGEYFIEATINNSFKESKMISFIK